MPGANDPILLDNCAISACVEVGGWKALCSRYRLETVTEVEREAATGYAHRDIIDPRSFREQVEVHPVAIEERLEQEAVFSELAALDDGERDLWIHALGRSDGWILCGPDIASIRFGVRSGHHDRMISLEELLSEVGFKPKVKLKEHYTAKWLKKKIGDFLLELHFERERAKKTAEGKA